MDLPPLPLDGLQMCLFGHDFGFTPSQSQIWTVENPISTHIKGTIAGTGPLACGVVLLRRSLMTCACDGCAMLQCTVRPLALFCNKPMD
ncbi:hypothetical protein C0081_06365 [Cohaesibacter celericrescens]|uniref:Uncharacterized protein n=1 Tax=Cohaesibacter celericrescens TaxID=2067669 RepID=A0A2N5XU82_9HYPH|nr:hypothetical protein C0081_06365 [Cohaesibacter celericrescens]